MEEAVSPLRQLINHQQEKIQSLTTENSQLKQHVDESIAKVEARYEHFRNLANATAIYMDKNVKLEKEVAVLHTKIEDLEQYGRRTSL